MLPNVYTAIQRRQYITLANATQFPPQTTPTWLAISVSVLPWLEGNRRSKHSLQTAYFHVHPSRGRYTVETCSKFNNHCVGLCVCVCVWLGARLSAVWLLQDRVELQPICPRDRDVGRHLPRHLWSHPQSLAAQVMVCELDWLVRGFVHVALSSQNDEVFRVEIRW